MSALVPVHFLWTLDLGFWTWIFLLGFGTGLGLLTIKNYILGHHSSIFCSLTSGEIDF